MRKITTLNLIKNIPETKMVRLQTNLQLNLKKWQKSIETENIIPSDIKEML